MHKNDGRSYYLIGFITWLLAALFFMYEFFLRTSMGGVAHQIISSLHLNETQFAQLGIAYAFTYGLMQLPVGIIVDRFKLIYVTTFAIVICAISALIFSHAQSFEIAFFSRLLMGFGSSFAFVTLLMVANTYFSKKYFGFFAGLSQFIGTLGPMLAAGPFVAYLFYNQISWRTGLQHIALIGFILAIIVFITFLVKPPKNKRKDGDSVPQSVKKLLKNKQAWLVGLYSAAQYSPIAFVGALWGTEFLQSHHLSQKLSADIISGAWLGYAIGCPLLGVLSDLIRRRKPILIGSALIGITTSLIYIYGTHLSYSSYFVLFFLFGLATAGQSVGFATVSEHVNPERKASALGFTNALITVFIVFTPIASSRFINLQTAQFNEGFLILPILFIFSLILTIFIKETFCRPKTKS